MTSKIPYRSLESQLDSEVSSVSSDFIRSEMRRLVPSEEPARKSYMNKLIVGLFALFACGGEPDQLGSLEQPQVARLGYGVDESTQQQCRFTTTGVSCWFPGPQDIGAPPQDRYFSYPASMSSAFPTLGGKIWDSSPFNATAFMHSTAPNWAFFTSTTDAFGGDLDFQFINTVLGLPVTTDLVNARRFVHASCGRKVNETSAPTGSIIADVCYHFTLVFDIKSFTAWIDAVPNMDNTKRQAWSKAAWAHGVGVALGLGEDTSTINGIMSATWSRTGTPPFAMTAREQCLLRNVDLTAPVQITETTACP